MKPKAYAPIFIPTIFYFLLFVIYRSVVVIKLVKTFRGLTTVGFLNDQLSATANV